MMSKKTVYLNLKFFIAKNTTTIWAFSKSSSLIPTHYNKYNNDEQFEILQELTKCDTETQYEQMLLRGAVIDLRDAGLPQAFNL